jgi:phosphonate transport system substrate-binding protein
MYIKNQHLFKLILFLLLVSFTIAACGGDDKEEESTATATPEATTTAAGQAIVLGDISSDVEETIQAHQPMVDFLAAHLDDFGITHGEVKVAPDMETMIAWMESGEVDLSFDSPYPVMILRNEAGGIPLLRRWRFGVEEYHSVFFALNDKGYTSIDDLKGQIVAFDTPFSTSGYMLPLAYLIANNYTATEYETTEAAAGADEIGYVFSNDDDNTIQWVISGKVAAGVTDNIYFGRIPEETRSQMTIFAETEDVPRQILVVAPDMSEDLKAAIKTLLIGMDETEEGQAVLENYQTTQFDEFSEGADAALERMQEIYEIVQGN